MSTEAPIYETTFTVGKRYRVRMAVQRPVEGKVTNLVCEWEPLPKKLKPHELEEYRVKHNAEFADLGERLGGVVAWGARWRVTDSVTETRLLREQPMHGNMQRLQAG
jgi:hypothetical protein